jgi:hypothetical protein
MKQTKKKPGRHRDIDRSNSTVDREKTTIQIFKYSLPIFQRLYFNAEKRKNKHHFFDVIINFIYENQQEFYEYFNKKLK